MLPLIFPPDSQSVASTTREGCVSVNSIGICDYDSSAWHNLISNFSGTILYMSGNQSGANDVQIRCDNSLGQDILFHKPAGSGDVFSSFQCIGDVDFTYHESISKIDTNVHVVYVDYFLNSSVSELSTTSPYIVRTFFDNGVEYHYNPLQAVIGIIIFTFVFLSLLFFTVKILRRW